MSSSYNPIPHSTTEQYSLLQQQIQDSLQKAQAHRNKLKKLDRRYSITNIVLGALATFIAGQSAVAGSPLVGNWRITATLASLLTLGATVISGVHKQVVSADGLSESSECVAKLKALKIELAVPTYELDGISEEYQRLLSEFSKVDFY
ncbi:MAG: hypothetical protein KME17_14935 [Cyanosarcina radialis HA8281-LM2]|jgi:hypothetical protein|nr:hypothetical protein [Cyanosarcina radialis HA8281-LM2]